MVREWKNEMIEKNLISLIFVWLRVEKWIDEKISLYKFIHIPLLKNNAQLKKESDKQAKKKNAITQIY